MKKLLLTLTTTLLLAACLSACNTGTSETSSSEVSSSEASSTTSVKPVQTFTVKFHDFDGKVIYETQVESGATATFKGEEPKIAATLEKCYPFTGWDKSLENVTSNLDVNPTHGEEYNISDFEFFDDCKVFQNASEFNDNTTNFIGYFETVGFMTNLKEEVKDGDSWETMDFIDFDDETVHFDYSGVNVAQKGDYTFKVTVRGLTKECPIEVVTNTNTWVFDKEVQAGYKTFCPYFASTLKSIKFYQDNKCLLYSDYYTEFEAFSYEMADENHSVIIKSEDGSIDCKYAYGSDIRNYVIDKGHQRNVKGTYFDWVHFDTAEDFTTATEVITGYAYITATSYGISSIFAATPKYEYNPETKIMKVYNPNIFTTLQYNPDSGNLTVVQ